MAVDAQKKTSWMGFPEPSDTDSIPRISAEEVAKLMGESNAGRSIQLVDVRRSDLTGYALVGSLNLPAHTFYPSRATITALLASTGNVILYCSSSMGRGPRCAGWLRDAFALSTATAPTTNAPARVKILEGGVKGFVARYQEDAALVYKLPDEVKAA